MNYKLTKNNLKIVLIALIVLLLAIIALSFLASHALNDSPKEIRQEEISASEKIHVRTKTINYNVDGFDVNMHIPEFADLPYSMNTYINQKIDNDLYYRNVYDELTSSIYDKSSIGIFKYNVEYVRYNYKDYISLVVTQEIQLGEERAISKKKTYVVDANKEKTTVLRDIMANKTSYKEKIVDYINTEGFKNRIELVGGRGITSIQDTQKFYIKDDGTLHIYFDPSEISPASFGALDFEMPFKWQEDGFVF